MSDQNKEIQVTIPLRWIDDGSPVVAVNQFILQHVDSQFHLIVGHAPFPLLLGTPEEQRAKVEGMGSASVHVRGRFLLDEPVLRSLHTILDGLMSKEGR